MLKTILFDFGGVIAEEGFRDGLMEIATRNRLDPGKFYRIGDELIYQSGYLTGNAGEADYWAGLRAKTGIRGSDGELREVILSRFIVRPNMLACVDFLRSKGFSAVMLSDQTNWLDEINRREDLFRHFDSVYNSIHTHWSKRDESTFTKICAILGVKPEESVFIDDNKRHIQRAASAGLLTIHFTSRNDFEKQLGVLTGISCT
jgi:putative hydrolase of the HAD superfamily